MPSSPKYSVIVPVYNRPLELEELLQSLTRQTFKDFDVIIVEDGSEQTSKTVCDTYSSQLSIQYFFKLNSGPGPSRNFGFEKAGGEFFVMFDSDCILPPSYFESVEKFLAATPVDAWGGPDRGHEKFTPLQQAMAYTMSSFWTTGGIRGGKNQAENFQPRSFNMGFKRKVWEVTKGFAFDRLAEDIELSIRMKEAGFKVALIADAFVYHKRRTDLWQFFEQVEGFGRGRVRVGKVHKGAVKITHWIPSAFLIYEIGLIALFLLQNEWRNVAVFPMLLYLFLIGITCFMQTAWATRTRYQDNGVMSKSAQRTHRRNRPLVLSNELRALGIGVLAVAAAVVQLTGYGLGFLREKVGF